MGKFNLKTHSDSIVSFLAGNMQNKSAAEIVQDAAGNLHPFGLHDEDPQQEQCIPAPRGRGPRVLQEDSKEHAAAAAAAEVAPTETRRDRKSVV